MATGPFPARPRLALLPEALPATGLCIRVRGDLLTPRAIASLSQLLAVPQPFLLLDYQLRSKLLVQLELSRLTPPPQQVLLARPSPRHVLLLQAPLFPLALRRSHALLPTRSAVPGRRHLP